MSQEKLINNGLTNDSLRHLNHLHNCWSRCYIIHMICLYSLSSCDFYYYDSEKSSALLTDYIINTMLFALFLSRIHFGRYLCLGSLFESILHFMAILLQFIWGKAHIVISLGVAYHTLSIISSLALTCKSNFTIIEANNSDNSNGVDNTGDTKLKISEKIETQNP